ncbi:MAG: GspE/PulE family protein [bacterium]
MNLGEVLVSEGKLTEEQVNDALLEQEISSKRLGEILVDKGYINEAEILKVVCRQNHYEYFAGVEGALINKDNSEFYFRNCCVYIEKDNKTYFIFNVLNLEIASFIVSVKDAVIGLATKETIYSYLSSYIDKISYQHDDVEGILLDILEISVSRRVSNLRVKKSGKTYHILIDTEFGIEVIKTINESTGERLINVIAIRCGITLSAGKNFDGKFEYKSSVTKRTVDIRTEFLPVSGRNDNVMHFEAVLRIHGISSFLELESLGFDKHDVDALKEALTFVSGLIIATGPTGAGKSTTFYSLLKLLAKLRRAIMTIEDPVELKLNEINITQMSVSDNFSYKDSLRAMLRSEPHVIMIGEMRDESTAAHAMRAAETGHLVLTTLHTNSALNAYQRLKGLGIGSEELSNVLRLVTSQRLYLPLCPDCRKEISGLELPRNIQRGLKREGINEIAVKGGEMNITSVFVVDRGKSCNTCHGRGYLPKKGIIEILIPGGEKTETLKEKGKKMLLAGEIDPLQFFSITG